MKCTVCTHPQCLDIDQALLSGEFTLAALSQKFGPSPSALQRHKGHLQDKMRESRRRLQEIREQGSLLLLNAFLDHVKRGVETAEAEGNLTGVFRGSYIGSRIIYQLNRMEGSMQLDTLHRLLTSPAWVPQASLLPTDPGLITGLHQALVDGACLPCPPAAPDDDGTQAADDYDIATRRQLQKLLPDLDLTLADLPPRPEITAKNQRKISEKLAGKTLLCAKKSQTNQKDTSSEKKSPKNPCVGRGNEVNPAFLENELDPTVLASEAPPAVSAADASSTIVAGDQAPDVTTMTTESETLSPETENDLVPNPCSLVPDPCLLETANRETKTVFSAPPVIAAADAPAVSSGFSYDPYLPVPETANSEPRASFYLPSGDPPADDDSEEILPEPPEGVDFCAAKDAEIFLMTHGYPKYNPPKHIPNRHLDEDTRGFSLFREIKKFF